MQNISQLHAISLMGLAFLAVLVLAQVFHRYFKLKGEHTRKFLHISVGLICVFLPYQFSNHWYVFFSTLIFLLLLIYAKRKQLLTSLHQIDRATYGDLFLPIVIYLNLLLGIYYDYERLFYLPLLIVTISDPAAYYGGFLFGKKEKSLHGSVFFVVTAFLSSWLFLSFYTDNPYPYQFWLLVVCAFAGAFVEYISGKKGWDNLTIPMLIGVILVVYFEWIMNYGTF